MLFSFTLAIAIAIAIAISVAVHGIGLVGLTMVAPVSESQDLDTDALLM